MDSDVRQTALMAYLGTKKPGLHQKILELREQIEGWLAYIPQTFQHYTRHTVKHSDAIVLQISRILFKDNDPRQATVPLSSAECFILAAAAYLHDAGMVTSDQEKIQILRSDEWKAWVAEGAPGEKRWQQIQELEGGTQPEDESLRKFIADVQTRFLVAEFVRRIHHSRAADFIIQHQQTLGRFAFDDPILIRTISDVCVAHGLRQYELEDREKYPHRRDILDEEVNVRFLAIMLRLGDLLDVSYERACPLLLNAACPLPPESLAHWSQYACIKHTSVSPDRIELTAECNTQDEHRYLQDWCQWLVEEVRTAAATMAHATRHHDWPPPQASLEGPDPTIIIRPSSRATYIPSQWRFELDADIVFERLVKDVYDSPNAFIRELIQNALDATRCKMYSDLTEDGLATPEFPTQVAQDYRARYPVRISLRTVEEKNEMSGELEARQLLDVDDSGIGMDKEIIVRYFLQVGRSYYTTEEFRRSFKFIPTSRFGVGFLSVFGASDRVMVETYKASSRTGSNQIRLTLVGPRNYLLSERGNRKSSGTRISVLLREPMAEGELTKLISAWCRRVEFPVIVEEFGRSTTIEAERPEQFTCEVPNVKEPNAKFVVRAFPVNRHGIEGEIYILAYVGSDGERWDRLHWALYEYPDKHPLALPPPVPDSLVCFHGIAMGGWVAFSYDAAARCRLDYRGAGPTPTLSRESRVVRHRDREIDPAIESRIEEILREHLATSPKAKSEDGWRYKQKLVGSFHLPRFWSSERGMIQIFEQGTPKLYSLEDVLRMPTITIVTKIQDRWHRYESGSEEVNWLPAVREIQTPLIMRSGLGPISMKHHNAIFTAREPTGVRWLPSGFLAVDWTHTESLRATIKTRGGRPLYIVALPDCSTVGFETHLTTHSTYDGILLNSEHPFAKWLVCVRDACTTSSYGLTTEQYNRLLTLCENAIAYTGNHLPALKDFLAGWRKIPGLPMELRPPDVELTSEMFEHRLPSHKP